MNKTLILALGLVSTAAAISVQAQTYQWKDAAGRTVISDTLPSGMKGARTIGGVQPPVVSEQPAEKTDVAPKTMAEKEAEFKKRQQEAKEKAEKEAKDQQIARQKQENCERAQRNLRSLEASRQLVIYNEKGERILVDDAQRAQEAEFSRRIVAENCN